MSPVPTFVITNRTDAHAIAQNVAHVTELAVGLIPVLLSDRPDCHDDTLAKPFPRRQLGKLLRETANPPV